MKTGSRGKSNPGRICCRKGEDGVLHKSMKTEKRKGYFWVAVLAGILLAGGCGSQKTSIPEKGSQAVEAQDETTSEEESHVEEIAGPVFDAQAAEEARSKMTLTPEAILTPEATPEVTPTPEQTAEPTVTSEAEKSLAPMPTSNAENIQNEESIDKDEGSENTQETVRKDTDAENTQGTISKPEHPDAVSHDKLIFIGDSRTEAIRDAVGDNSIWSCLSSKGYDWMVSTGVPQIEDEIEDNTAVIILMGVNDVYQLSNYITYINAKANEWADLGAKTYFVSVGPVQNDPYVTNREIENFNASMEANLVGVTYIDVYSHLVSNGFSTLDGTHYPDSVSIEIYNYILEHLEESRSGIWG